MRLTSFTDYGLRMLMRMASVPDQVFSTAALADELDLSRNHLSKIIQRLSQAGVVQTRRGGGGGAILVHKPQDLRLGSLVRLLEHGQPLVECLADGSNNCSLDGRCGLKGKLQAAERVFLAELDKTTLADIAIAAGK
ncbi:Rrf2 family transcriptional regulator [Cognatishimia sp. MH4019]|uniref:RrF2 family transcriptional regulator n=1 Tax=Cognatishimia sp. MH4019 TaxID=2854030 RepID=UPI001CD5593B|nr:Rrf2 family transcriptional regulator [Cognatishimia sp. MH4019]